MHTYETTSEDSRHENEKMENSKYLLRRNFIKKKLVISEEYTR
jgi:hypothetical protein